MADSSNPNIFECSNEVSSDLFFEFESSGPDNHTAYVTARENLTEYSGSRTNMFISMENVTDDDETNIIDSNNNTADDGLAPDSPLGAGAATLENPEDEAARRVEGNPPPPAERFNVIDLSADFEDLYDYLDALVHLRNENCPFFLRDEGLNTSSASSVPHFETSEVHEPSADSLDLEIERLKLQKANLKGEVSRLEKKISFEEAMTKTEVKSCEEQTSELEEKTKVNLELAKEAKKLTTLYKAEAANNEFLGKDLAKRIDFPKKVLQKFVGVSGDIVCTDNEFCSQFSGGKCASLRGEEPK